MREVEDAIVEMLKKSPFYGYFLVGTRRYVSKKYKTAAVSVTDKINLYINPDYFLSLSLEDRIKLLKHECGHVLGLHCIPVRRKDRKAVGWNIATDIAINQYIADHPKNWLTPEFFPNPVEKLQDSEYYYDQLQSQKQDLMKKHGKGDSEGDGVDASDVFDDMTADDHSAWDESTDNLEKAESVVKARAKEAKDKAGNVPGEVQGMLDELFAPKVDWRKQLNHFFQATQKSKKVSSRKKRNRRYGLLYPGRKKDDHFRIYVPVDTSGSVSDQWLKMFFSEIDGIARTMDVSIKVLIADAQIQNTFEYEPGMKIPISGRGGTAYQPALDYTNASDEQVDGMIYFGDGDAFDEPVKPKYPVLWAFVGKETNPFKFGHFISIKE